MVDYSFYSKEHGGTFHFLQFNIMRTNEVSISEDSLLKLQKISVITVKTDSNTTSIRVVHGELRI